MTEFEPPKVHELKAWPKFYIEMMAEHKKFELRKNDRGYKVGDILWIREWDPDVMQYTGNALHAVIKYILYGDSPDMRDLNVKNLERILPPDFCIMSFEIMHKEYHIDAK